MTNNKNPIINKKLVYRIKVEKIRTYKMKFHKIKINQLAIKKNKKNRFLSPMNLYYNCNNN